MAPKRRSRASHQYLGKYWSNSFRWYAMHKVTRPYSQYRKVWTSVTPIQAQVYEHPLGEGDDYRGEAVDLYIASLRMRPYKVRLSIMRPDELEVLREVVNEAFDRALAIARPRHQANVEALKAGAKPDMSLYRAKPKVFREGDDLLHTIDPEILEFERDE